MVLEAHAALAVDDDEGRHAAELKQVHFLAVKIGDFMVWIRRADERAKASRFSGPTTMISASRCAYSLYRWRNCAICRRQYGQANPRLKTRTTCRRPR